MPVTRGANCHNSNHVQTEVRKHKLVYKAELVAAIIKNSSQFYSKTHQYIASYIYKYLKAKIDNFCNLEIS